MDHWHRVQRGTETPKRPPLLPADDLPYATVDDWYSFNFQELPLAAWCAGIDGARQGPYLVWDENGRLEARAHYLDDRLVGEWIR